MNTRDSRFLSTVAWGHRHRLLLLSAMAIAMVFIGSAALAQESSLRHKFLMRGQVLEVQNNTLVLCVGSEDGAAVGQELNVIRHSRIAVPPKAPGPGFRRDNVGKVKITRIFYGHYAQATVIKGDARVNDTVETQRP